MLNDITKGKSEIMSHLVRSRGKDTVQCAHCAVGIILGLSAIFWGFFLSKKCQKSVPTKCSHPVDASGDGCELGFLVFLLDEVAQAGEYFSTSTSLQG